MQPQRPQRRGTRAAVCALRQECMYGGLTSTVTQFADHSDSQGQVSFNSGRRSRDSGILRRWGTWASRIAPSCCWHEPRMWRTPGSGADPARGALEPVSFFGAAHQFLELVSARIAFVFVDRHQSYFSAARFPKNWRWFSAIPKAPPSVLGVYATSRRARSPRRVTPPCRTGYPARHAGRFSLPGVYGSCWSPG